MVVIYPSICAFYSLFLENILSQNHSSTGPNSSYLETLFFGDFLLLFERNPHWVTSHLLLSGLSLYQNYKINHGIHCVRNSVTFNTKLFLLLTHLMTSEHLQIINCIIFSMLLVDLLKYVSCFLFCQ